MHSRKLILASASPRRRELLQSLGIPFEVRTAGIDETPHAGEKPDALVMRLAETKARAIAILEPAAVIVAADTTVATQESDGSHVILEKPKDEADACRMLGHLSGKTHSVFTGTCVMIADSSFVRVRVTETTVRFDSLTTESIAHYVSTGEPMDKAGAYAIQGIGGIFVKSIDGSYSNVVGLPLAELAEDLSATGVWTDFPVRPAA
ncbi:MAG: Maf family protein [Bdellovibrionota bacterium]